MTRCYLLLKALLFALELLFPVAILAVLHDVCTATARAFIDNHFSDHAPLYHQLALNHYR
jgi:3',5'-cyclic AMP phosphodiesterase CpdA